jgi:hypothetical protein
MFQTECTLEMRTNLLPARICVKFWQLKSGISWIDPALPLLNMRKKPYLLAKVLQSLVEGLLRFFFMILLEDT